MIVEILVAITTLAIIAVATAVLMIGMTLIALRSGHREREAVLQDVIERCRRREREEVARN